MAIYETLLGQSPMVFVGDLGGVLATLTDMLDGLDCNEEATEAWVLGREDPMPEETLDA